MADWKLITYIAWLQQNMAKVLWEYNIQRKEKPRGFSVKPALPFLIALPQLIPFMCPSS